MNSHLHPTVTGTFILQLTESQARALEALMGYDCNMTLRVFYNEMGKHYLEPHEQGFRALHEEVRSQLKGQLARMDKARAAFKE